MPIHRTSRSLIWLVLPLLASGLAGCAGGRSPDLNFTLAYTHVDMQEEGGFEPVIDTDGGVRTAVGIDGPVALSDDRGSSLRLGGRLSFSGYREDIGDRVVADEPLLEIEEFVDLALFSPHFVVAYRQVIGDEEGGAFIEPGLGLGLTIGVLSFGSDLRFGDRPIGTDIDETETELGMSLNPFLRGGWTNGRLLIGAEGGYQWTSLEFDDDLGSDPAEWYVGIFFGVTLGT